MCELIIMSIASEPFTCIFKFTSCPISGGMQTCQLIIRKIQYIQFRQLPDL